MIHRDARQCLDNRVGDACRIERVGVPDRQQEARNAAQGWDMSCAHGINGDLRMRGWKAGEVGVWEGCRLEIEVAESCGFTWVGLRQR